MMRMRPTIGKVVEEGGVDVEGHTVCNKCGLESEVNIINKNKYQNIHCSFGYGSNYDGQNWSFDLCEKCLVEIIKTFKYAPYGFLQNKESHLIEKDHQKVFDSWKKTGEWNAFMDYTVEELEDFRKYFRDEYLDEVIKDVKNKQQLDGN